MLGAHLFLFMEFAQLQVFPITSVIMQFMPMEILVMMITRKFSAARTMIAIVLLNISMILVYLKTSNRIYLGMKQQLV